MALLQPAKVDNTEHKPEFLAAAAFGTFCQVEEAGASFPGGGMEERMEEQGGCDAAEAFALGWVNVAAE